MVYRPSEDVRDKLFEQTGKRKDVLADAARKALPPGYRLSKNGKWYLETRKNRSDRKGKRV